MYYPGQVVCDLDAMKAITVDDIWDVDGYPKRHTHFIKAEISGDLGARTDYVLYMPKSVDEANMLMARGIIVPAPSRPDHCWKCGNWISNCKSIKKCTEWSEHGPK